jgi:hypothetical protein
MKLSVLLVTGSLVANAALIGVYFSRTSPNSGAPSAQGATLSSANAPAAAGSTAGDKKSSPRAATDSVAIKPWGDLNTSDFKELAARLKAAGFPPAVVRAILYAQISDSFKARREQLMPPVEDKPFWKTDGSGWGWSGYDAKTMAAMRQLNREQTQLMRDVLGADYNAGNIEVSDYERRRYGDLPKDKIDHLRRLDEDYNELRNEVQMNARGMMLPEDREKLAMLEKEKRADLAQLLTPQEMEDYLMRTSQTTMRLRTPLTAFKATEEEFRTIYRIQAAFDDKYSYQNVGFNSSPDFARERGEAQKQVSEQMKAALGEQRYADYMRASDREYQQLTRIAQRTNLADGVALQAYEVRNNASKESNRIYADAQLTAEQKRAALQTLAQNTRAQINSTLGAEAAATYFQVADRWLTRMERGSAVTFNETGNVSFRNIAPPRPATPATTPAPASSSTSPK